MTEQTVSSNERLIAVLHALVTRKGEGRDEASGVRELADELDISRSTVSRILLELARQELAAVSGRGGYHAGPRLRVLAAALYARHPLLSQAGEVLELLAEQTASTVIVALHDAPRPQVVVVACRRRPGPVHYSLEPGTVLPLHAGATGRAVLGRLGLETLGTQALEASTPDTVTDRTRLDRLLDEDRELGYTISVGQRFRLAAGVAAPLQYGGLTGSISITRPRYLTDEEDLARFGPLARRAAGMLQERCEAAVRTVAGGPPADPYGRGTALERMSRLVAALAAEPLGIGVGQRLARRVGANIATANRLVATATATGIAIARNGMLLPGPRLLHWAACLGPGLDVPSATGHILRDLAERTGETVGLVRFDSAGRRAELTAVINGTRPLHYGLSSGVPIPLYAGAAGRAVLAHCPPETFAGLDLEPFTERTPVSRDALAAGLRTVRDRGYATGDGEHIPDAFDVGAPYFVDGHVAGSITATVPRFRVPEIDLASLAEAVMDAARRTTRMLSVTAG